MIGDPADDRLRETVRWWREWAGGCDVPETAAGAVLRSAITLRSLVYPPTGAVLAAPTAGLPEHIGGERNWDYRYCWIRDASFTMRSMLKLGVHREASGFFSWLMHATRVTRPRLRVLYDVHGRVCPPERTLEHLRGFRRSRPVRVGNDARGQLQLDTYGALLDAAWQFHRAHGIFDAAAGRMLRGFARTARDSWRRPDRGIWEIRSEPRHHTLSKAMCWVAMDRAIRLARDGVLRLDVGRWQRDADEIRAAVSREGFSPDLGSYTATLGGDDVDASLLLLSVYGFEEAGSERMRGTIDRVYERLADGPTLRRYRDVDDGVSGREGSFGICGFWGVEALARAGREDEAREAYGRLMSQSNDLGLFAEEISTPEGRALGNFPQALTHVGAINAACGIAAGPSTEPAGAERG